MHKLLFCLSLFLFISTSRGSNFKLTQNAKDSLFNVLDNVIKNKQIYTNKKSSHISELKKQLSFLNSDEDRFAKLGQIFEEYKTFQIDSALLVANKRSEIANKSNSIDKKYSSQMDFVSIMIVAGMYTEALDLLNKQNTSTFNLDNQKAILYHHYHSLYIAMADNSFFYENRMKYLKLESLYKDSILKVLPSNNPGYNLVKISKLCAEKKYKEAYNLSIETYSKHNPDLHFMGMLSYGIASIFINQNKRSEAEYFLILSSINDLRSGVREYISLPELAKIVYENGDIDRSYSYMKCSLEDAISCKARLRSLQISKTIPIINAAYEAKMKKDRNRLVLVLTITCISLLALIFLIVYIYKKLKELRIVKQNLRLFNKQLKQANENLNSLNSELTESNHIKEEYLGYVFSICSMYIEKIDTFRKKINRKIKGGQTNELLQQTSSQSFIQVELKDFYQSFDSIFLNLYPTFVKDFNALLLDNKQITLKEGELLNPELRIYALVRLGITDSTKIAKFLHYSPQTIYNYRLKIRNNAKLSKDDLYRAIRCLGKK